MIYIIIMLGGVKYSDIESWIKSIVQNQGCKKPPKESAALGKVSRRRRVLV